MSGHRLAILGCGIMGEAIVGGLLRAAIFRADEIVATARRPEAAEGLGERHGVAVTLDNLAACRSGIGWGMCPRELVRAELDRGSLQALSAEVLEVPLYWQAPAQAWALLEPVTQAVVEAARQGLRR